MRPAPLRWGILGTGRVTRWIVGALAASERNVAAAVASRSAERAAAFAREWGLPRAVHGYAALVDDPGIDVVYNALPNHLHSAWTVAAARAGKHVLCERPLALSVEEVDAIAAAARDAGVVVTEGFMYRHHPQTEKAREMVAAGAIGALCLIRGSFTFTLSRPEDVRLDPTRGGGSLWDVGCYPVGWARLLAGVEPAEVAGWAVRGSTGIDESFAGQIRFAAASPGGPDVLAQFDCGFRLPYRAHVEAVGTEGILTVPRPYRPQPRDEFTITRGEETETVRIEGPEPYRGEIEDMADAVLLGRAPRIDLADSRANVATLDALLRSAAEGRPLRPA